MAENESLRTTIAQLQPQPQPTGDLVEMETQILLMIAKRPDIVAIDIAGAFQVMPERAKYHLEKLSKDKYLSPTYIGNQPARYRLGQKGREYLIGKGLI